MALLCVLFYLDTISFFTADPLSVIVSSNFNLRFVLFVN